jgi:hypothetical protein
MTVASDSAVDALRATKGLLNTVLVCSSYARKEKTRRWLRYPGEIIKFVWRSKRNRQQQSIERPRRPFLEAAALGKDLNGKVKGTANQILASMGYNQWVPKIPGQKVSLSIWDRFVMLFQFGLCWLFNLFFDFFQCHQ